MHTVISILNIKRLHEVIGYSMQEFGDDAIGFDFLQYPSHLSIQNTNIKAELIELVTENYLPISPDAQAVIEYIKGDSNMTLSLQEVVDIENKSLVSGSVEKLLF